MFEIFGRRDYFVRFFNEICLPNCLARVTITILSIFSLTLFASPVKKNHVEAELISEVQTIHPGLSFDAGIRLKMDPKWHTYWKNPGEAGLATTVNWSLPDGFHAGEIQWPYPKRFNDNGIISMGYDGEVVLLTRIDVDASVKPRQHVKLQARVNWLACKEICIPGNANLKLTLPLTTEPPQLNERVSTVFRNFRAKLPRKQTDWAFQANSAENYTVELLAIPPNSLSHNVGSVTFFPEREIPLKLDGSHTWTPTEGKYRLILELLPEAPEMPTQIRGVLVSDNGWEESNTGKAVEIDVTFSDEISAESTITQPIAVSSATNITFIFSLVFAFVGGLILNLMPCVFPVISLKILGFVNQAHDGSKIAARHGLIFAAGVLVSFWILAAILLGIRASGEQIGWGFQLQSPSFVISLAILMFLLALNLFGVYEIGLSLTRSGSVLVGKSGWVESFLSGVLATVVATPCTAPFMGAALGFALSQPPVVSFGIFTFLGLGMAFPYVLLSRFQALIKFIPRPGAWMEHFKKLMGFFLMATVVWLLWLLQILAGSRALINLIAGFLIIALGAWIYGTWGSGSGKMKIRFTAILTALIFLVTGISHPIRHLPLDESKMDSTSSSSSHNSNSIDWQEFTPEKVERLRAEGRRVFIDFTAAWCLSCLANERVAFSSKEVQKRFKDLNIVPIKADWTHRNEEITRALAKFGRSGVPLYVLYDGHLNSAPVILPEILTPGIVLDALNKLEKNDENVNATNI